MCLVPKQALGSFDYRNQPNGFRVISHCTSHLMSPPFCRGFSKKKGGGTLASLPQTSMGLEPGLDGE